MTERKAKEHKMSDNSNVQKQPASAIPPDNLQRMLAVAQPDTVEKFPHIGAVGDTYTILLTGKETAGRFCLIDMQIPRMAGRLTVRTKETFIVIED
jgi:hypothetical protein